MCISRSFGDLITARTLIPTEFLSMYFVLRQKPMKNHLFSMLSGDESVMWSDKGADTRKRRKGIYLFVLRGLNTQKSGTALKPDKMIGDDKNMPYRKDRIKKLIGFSPDEWSIVCKKSKAAKLRTGTYIRRMAVKGEVKIYELKELSALKRAFLSIGNNVNQIAEVANSSGSVYQKDIEDLQKEFKYFRSVMKNNLFEISPTYIS
mgnify:FL=1